MEAIDTLAFAKKLKSAGLPEAQAEAFAEAQAGMFRGMLDSTLATKDDLAHLETSLRAEIAQVRTELGIEIAQVRTELGTETAQVRAGLGTEIAQLRTDMWRIVLGQTIALTGIIFAAAAFF